MRELFLKILSMGINASWLIVGVLILRLIFRKAPKWIFCFLWVLTGLKLLCPFSIPSAFSLIPAEINLQDIVHGTQTGENGQGIGILAGKNNLDSDGIPANKNNAGIDILAGNSNPNTGIPAGKNNPNTGIPAGKNNPNTGILADNSNPNTGILADNSIPNTGILADKNNNGHINSGGGSVASGSQTGESQSSPGISFIASPAIAILWFSGMLLMLLYLTGSFLRMKKKLSTATHYRDNIWESEFVDVPFIFGLAKPRIYIPYHMEGRQLAYILAHENAHLKRKDHLMKTAAFFILSIYWFHPLVWVSYIFMCRDIELACDEKVVQILNKTEKKEYLLTLLNCSILNRDRKKNGGRHASRKVLMFSKIGIPPLGFGETGIKRRVVYVKNFKKKPAGIAAIILLVCVTVSGCLLTAPNPIKMDNSTPGTIGSADKSNAEQAETGSTDGSTEKQAETLDVKPASMDLSASTGADGVNLYYVDAEKIIFGGWFGLFVFDKNSHAITHSLNLEYIECNYTQGDRYCDIAVDKAGERVYLKPMHKQVLYIFNLGANTLEKEAYTSDIWKDSALDLYRVTDKNGKKRGYLEEKAADSALHESAGRNKRICEVTTGIDHSVGSCVYADFSTEKYEEAVYYYPLFWPENCGELQHYAPEDFHGIVSVSMRIGGKMHEITDASACKKVEKILTSGSTKIKGGSACPFYDPVYITRADGTTGIIWPATDSCNMILSEKGYYETKKDGIIWDALGDWYKKL